MKSFFTTFFNSGGKPKGDYKGLSDFIVRASSNEKLELFKEAAEKANEDQYKVYKAVEHKMKSI